MKIAAISPNPSDGTAWYRSSLPFIRMQQKYDDFQFQEFGLSNIDWDILMNFDVLFLQRPCSPEQVRIAHKAQFLGLKVWVDYDDMLWGIHPSSPVYAMYRSAEITDAINRIMNMKGILITVSTERLGLEIRLNWPNTERENDIQVIPNSLEERQLKNDNWCYDHQGAILWRGSETHVSDLDIYRGYYDTVMLDNPGIQFDFFGYNPWYWTSRIANANHIPGSPLIDYYAKTFHPKWGIWVCMLEDTPFNRCKSNILYLEATMAGAVCVCPDWPEWNKPGAFVYKDIIHFKEVMQEAIEAEPDEYAQRINQARIHILSNQNLAKNNIVRYNLLDKLLTT
jgi:hypothetical protein